MPEEAGTTLAEPRDDLAPWNEALETRLRQRYPGADMERVRLAYEQTRATGSTEPQDPDARLGQIFQRTAQMPRESREDRERVYNAQQAISSARDIHRTFGHDPAAWSDELRQRYTQLQRAASGYLGQDVTLPANEPYQQHGLSQRRLEHWTQRIRQEGDVANTADYWMNKRAPVGRYAFNIARNIDVDAAEQRIQRGEGRDQDYITVASSRVNQELSEARRGPMDTLLGLPATLIELGIPLGGAALGARAGAAGAARLGLTGRVGQFVGSSLGGGAGLAATNLVPQTADAAVEQNLQAGRGPWNVAGFAEAIPDSVMQGAIFEGMGRIGQGMSRAGVRGAIERGLVRAGVGVASQEAAGDASDALYRTIHGAYRTQTPYGILGAAATGQWGEAWQRLVSSTIVNGAFATVHGVREGLPRGRLTTETLVRELQTLHEQGVPRDRVPEILARQEAPPETPPATPDVAPATPEVATAARPPEAPESPPASAAPPAGAPASPAAEPAPTGQPGAPAGQPGPVPEPPGGEPLGQRGSPTGAPASVHYHPAAGEAAAASREQLDGGDAHWQTYPEERAGFSPEQLQEAARRDPVPLPRGGNRAPEAFRQTWDLVSRLWPEAAAQVKRIEIVPQEQFRTPNSRASLTTTGTLRLPEGRDVPPEVLWHELVHADQLGRGDLPRSMKGLSREQFLAVEREAYSRQGQMQQSGALDRLQDMVIAANSTRGLTPAPGSSPTSAGPVAGREPSPAAPDAAAGPPEARSMEDLTRRFQTGGRVQVEEVYRAAGLDERERAVVEGLMAGRSLAEAGAAAGLNSRQRAHQVATSAGRKLGIEGSLVDALQSGNEPESVSPQEGRRLLQEAGGSYRKQEMSQRPDLQAAARRGRQGSADPVEKIASQILKHGEAIDQLQAKREREEQHGRNPARIERYNRELERLHGEIERLAAEARGLGGLRTGPPDQAQGTNGQGAQRGAVEPASVPGAQPGPQGGAAVAPAAADQGAQGPAQGNAPPAPAAAVPEAAGHQLAPFGMGAMGGPGTGFGGAPPPPGKTIAAPEVPEPGPRPQPAGQLSALERTAAAGRNLGNYTFPRLTKVAPRSAEQLASASNSPVHWQDRWNYLSQVIQVRGMKLADLPLEARRELGATIVETRARLEREALQREGKSTDDVGTLVGAPQSPLQTEAQYQDNLHFLRELRESLAQEWTPLVEKDYRDLKNLDPQDAIDARNQIPGMPMSLIGVDPETPGAVALTGRKQGLENLRVKAPGFLKQATLTGEAYDVDLLHMMQRRLQTGTEAAARARFVRQALADGVLQAVGPGQRPSEGFEALALDPARGLPGIDPRAHYYARSDLKGEMQQGLGIDERPGQKLVGRSTALVGKALDPLTTTALTGFVEPVTHGFNHIQALFASGSDPVSAVVRSLRNSLQVWMKDPEALRKVMELSNLSASFGHTGRTGIVGSVAGWFGENAQKRVERYDPTYWWNHLTSTFIDGMQKGVRLHLGESFDQMVRSGQLTGEAASAGAKRDFLNTRLGNYNNRSNSPVVQFLKDTGFQPFATAASTFTTQGVRNLAGGTNLQARNWQQSLQWRATNYAKFLPLLALGPAVNLLLWGDAFPEGGTPLAIKTGEEGNKIKEWDPLTLIGMRRGARALGIEAVAEGLLRGDKTAGQVYDRAQKDAWHSVLHLLAGPAPDFLHTGLYGETVQGRRLAPIVSTAQTARGQAAAEARGAPPAGSSQSAQNWRAAVSNLNPLVARLTGADQPREQSELADRLMPNLGPLQPRTRSLPRPPRLSPFGRR